MAEEIRSAEDLFKAEMRELDRILGLDADAGSEARWQFPWRPGEEPAVIRNAAWESTMRGMDGGTDFGTRDQSIFEMISEKYQQIYRRELVAAADNIFQSDIIDVEGRWSPPPVPGTGEIYTADTTGVAGPGRLAVGSVAPGLGTGELVSRDTLGVDSPGRTGGQTPAPTTEDDGGGFTDAQGFALLSGFGKGLLDLYRGYASYRHEAQRRQLIESAANFRTAQEEINEKFSDLMAEEAIKIGDKQAREYGKQVSHLVGEQRAAFAGSGVVVDSGSPLALQGLTQETGALDAAEIRNNAWRQAFGYKQQSVAARFRARSIEISRDHALAGSRTRGRQALLTGGLNALSDFAVGVHRYRQVSPARRRNADST